MGKRRRSSVRLKTWFRLQNFSGTTIISYHISKQEAHRLTSSGVASFISEDTLRMTSPVSAQSGDHRPVEQFKPLKTELDAGHMNALVGLDVMTEARFERLVGFGWNPEAIPAPVEERPRA